MILIRQPYKINIYFKAFKKGFENVHVWVIPQVGHEITYENCGEFFTGKVESCKMVISKKRQDINITVQ